MTNETAILTITTMAFFLVHETELDDKTKEEIKEASKMAIEALEKQMAKKPKVIKEVVDLGNGYSVKITETYRCPECDRRITKGNRCYGLECGQKIDWGDCE